MQPLWSGCKIEHLPCLHLKSGNCSYRSGSTILNLYEREREVIPEKFRSLPKDALDPLNEDNGNGTGTGTLIPTWDMPNSCQLTTCKSQSIKWVWLSSFLPFPWGYHTVLDEFFALNQHKIFENSHPPLINGFLYIYWCGLVNQMCVGIKFCTKLIVILNCSRVTNSWLLPQLTTKGWPGLKGKEKRPLIKYRAMKHLNLQDRRKGWLTSPASTSFWNFLAAMPDVVKMEAPLPHLRNSKMR